ncbi:hypothetical protein [uncultured Pelagimonas sp.]|uniref:hypothetical protein n=1 Tax=uncultured Pelagimonas sp. TaxID=1618102 RepID=UPI002602B312|nr:hypothetical protein [uncultured Pelagimonas sp.]
MYKFLAGMIVMAAIGAFLSKPTQDDAYEEIAHLTRATLEQQQLHEAQGVRAAALLACRLSPQSCVELLMSGLDLNYEDRILYAKIDLDGFGMEAKCYGAFSKFYCPNGLVKQ